MRRLALYINDPSVPKLNTITPRTYILGHPIFIIGSNDTPRGSRTPITISEVWWSAINLAVLLYSYSYITILTILT